MATDFEDNPTPDEVVEALDKRRRRNETVKDDIKIEYRANRRLFRLEVWNERSDPDGPPNFVVRIFPSLSRVNFTSWTTAEVEGLKQFFNDVFDQVIPVTQELDDRANEAFEAGDTRQRRVYVPDPQRIDYE